MLQFRHDRRRPQVLFGDLSNSNIIKISYNQQSIMNKMNAFLSLLSQNCLYRKILSVSCNSYAIRAMKLQTISPDQLQLHFKKVIESKGETESKGLINIQQLCMQGWNNNELRIFAWISVCYSYIHGKSFTRFTDSDYLFLAEAFPNKSRAFIEYNLRILSKEENSNRRSKLTEDQITLFSQIMKQQKGEYKWTQVSLQLFIRSDKEFFQTPQKCREQWLNHLNPEVNKEKWSLDEDIVLFQSVLKDGKKWSQISKSFNGKRTEHMVKNRYKSILNKNQAKNKKNSQKKFCQNVLMALQASLTQLETQHPKSSMLNNESSEIAMQECASLSKNQYFSETKVESQIKNNLIIEDHEIPASLKTEQNKPVNNHQIQNSCETFSDFAKMQLQEIDFLQQAKYKTEEELYIESLLF